MALTIGKKLQKLRKKNGMSQQQLADHLNVARQTIGKWEQDLSLPDLETLIEMSELFDISLNELVGIEEKSSDMVPVTYTQMQTIVDNIQKQNQSRNLLQYVVILLCISSMVFTASLKMQYNKQDVTSSNTDLTSQMMLEDYFSDDHFINKLTDYCITQGGIEERTRFDIANYDLENWEITLDYQIFLKEYSPSTQLSIKFDALMSLPDEDFSLNFQKVNENEFVLNQTIPLEDYSNISLIIKDEENTIIEKLGSMQYLTHILKSQIWLYVPFDETLLLNQIAYNPNFINSNEITRTIGTLDGTLTIRFLNENHQLLFEHFNIDMSKRQIITLPNALPSNEKIYIQVDYALDPKNINAIKEKTYSGSLTGTNTSTYFIITSIDTAYDICHYVESTNHELNTQY